MDTESELYVKLQGIIERSKGAVLWSDICLALKRAQEAKVREQLNSMFSEMDLPTLAKAHSIAERETITPQDKILASVSITQPAAIKAAGKPKRK